MTARELIQALQSMPADASVYHLWDGALRTEINHVWLTRDGHVATGDYEQECYYTSDRPVDAPTREELSTGDKP